MRKILFSLLSLLITTACVTDDDPPVYSIGVGDPMPEFTVTTIDGKTVTSASLRGRVTVITLFTTTCGQCREQLPTVQQVYDASQGVNFLCIAREQLEHVVAEFWESESLTMPVSPQEGRDVYSLFATSVVPRIYVFTPEGVVSATFSDSPVASREQLLDAISKASAL